MRTFKILAIDGGGIKGLYTLYLLKAIQEKYCNGQPLSEYFDMIVGTSTGAIIAAGLSLWGDGGIDRLIKIYEDDSKHIFPKDWCSWLGNWTRLITRGHFYDNVGLINVLKCEIGNETMSKFNNLVCLPSYNLVTNENCVFRTPYDYEFSWDSDVLIRDAVLSSSAAPIYFPSYAFSSTCFEGNMVDGGIWANNPTLVANNEYNQLNKLLKRNNLETYDRCMILNMGNIDDDRIGSPITSVFGVKALIDWIMRSNSMFVEQFPRNEDRVRVQRISSRGFFESTECFDLDDAHQIPLICTLGKDHGARLTTETDPKFVDLSGYFQEPKTFDVDTIRSKPENKIISLDDMSCQFADNCCPNDTCPPDCQFADNCCPNDICPPDCPVFK